MKKLILIAMMLVAVVCFNGCQTAPHVVTAQEVSAAGKILNDPKASKEDLSNAGKIMAEWKKQQANKVK